MIKNNIKLPIIETIKDNKNFDEYDFKITTSTFDSKINIEYEYDNNYSFEFSLPKETTEKEIIQNGRIIKKAVYVFMGIMRPGKYSFLENFNVNSLGELLEKIGEWLEYTDYELSNQYTIRKIDSQNIEIEEMKKNMEEFLEKTTEEVKKSANEYFSTEEVSDIKKRLDEIEERLIKEINEYEDKEKERDKQIEELKNDIEKMRKASNSITKKNWLKKIITIFISWSTDPLKQKLVFGGYKGLVQISKFVGIEIPEQITSLLPQNIDILKK